MKLIVGAVLSMALVGCLDQSKRPEGLVNATKQAEGIVIAAKSPDAAVKSWWAVRDAGIALDREACYEFEKMKSPTIKKLKALASKDLLIPEVCIVDDPLSFDRKITKVEIESDTRSVVMAVIKNSTPPDPGAEFDDSDREAKESGEKYRYTLERKDTSGNWQISRIENFPSYARDWEDAYTEPKPSINRYVYDQYQ
ncbi:MULTISPECIES: hypothetical protein [unclassified Pseudomonas]|uniref:hypothetical protein n=1 Tax=unclassified Pseudomonas TaxID=196821 RepID=UPI001B319152|nr:MULTISPECIES: hypothetical protein [unclassified Pseudomonas]MBP5948265.1 hypothetical protein [Pseudomonas sp. P9(2020)]MBZ9560652.1 hypothetical protein [Pseudomonas sp. P116]